MIRGPGRVDVFWGRGPDADLAASEMKQPGDLYVLVPKSLNARRTPPAKRQPIRSRDADGRRPSAI